MSMAAMPWPWPPKDNVVLTRADLEDGVFTLSFDISGKLRCQIRNEQQTIEVASCYLMVLWPNIYTYVTVTWDWPDIEIFVEKQHLVGSNARSGLIPNQFLIVGGKPNPNLFDFSACNAKAMTRRHGRFAGSQPSDQTNLFQALRAHPGSFDSGRRSCQSAEHEADHGEADESGGLPSVTFKVFG
jgi:hypothetical protein